MYRLTRWVSVNASTGCQMNFLWVGALTAALLIVLIGCSSKKTSTDRSTQSDTMSVTDEAVHAPAQPTPKELDLQTYRVERSVDPREVQTFDSTCIVELPPTEDEHASAERKGAEEDFETASDDYYYYASIMYDRAQLVNVRVVPSTKRYLRFLVNDSVEILVDTEAEGARTANPFLFKRGKLPEVLGLVYDPDTSKIERYFGIQQ